MFQKIEFVEMDTNEWCYLVTFDFKGAQRRGPDGRYLYPKLNRLRGQFYAKIKKRFPGLAIGKATDSDVPAVMLDDAEEIYEMVIVHKGTALPCPFNG